MLNFWNRLVTMESDRLTKQIFDWDYAIYNSGSYNWLKNMRYILSLVDENDVCKVHQIN